MRLKQLYSSEVQSVLGKMFLKYSIMALPSMIEVNLFNDP